jgi:hypothetical protein
MWMLERHFISAIMSIAPYDEGKTINGSNDDERGYRRRVVRSVR